MKKYEINKYPPLLFNGAHFLYKDWTACTDIGVATSYGMLSKEEYLRVEAIYTAAVVALERTIKPASLCAHGVEFWDHESSALTSLGLDDVLDGSTMPHEGEQVTGARLENIVRRCLREVAWLELAAKPRLLIHFGYDLRLVVASPLPLEPVFNEVRASGLFVYESHAPLPTLDSWMQNDW